MANEVGSIRKELLALLRGGNAHVTFEAAVEKFPVELRGVVPENLPYSAWQLVEHIRITQHDIFRFTTNFDGKYVSPKWPAGYWPKEKAPIDARAWDESIARILADREDFEKLVEDPESDLTAFFWWGEGQTLLREALLIGDHTSYHTGELILVRRLLGIWPVE